MHPHVHTVPMLIRDMPWYCMVNEAGVYIFVLMPYMSLYDRRCVFHMKYWYICMHTTSCTIYENMTNETCPYPLRIKSFLFQKQVLGGVEIFRYTCSVKFIMAWCL